MAEFPSEIAQINGAKTTKELINSASQFSAEATGPGGMLYTGKVGKAGAGTAPTELAKRDI